MDMYRAGLKLQEMVGNAGNGEKWLEMVLNGSNG